MRLTVVGCAPAYTSRSGRASSCYLVEHGPDAVLFDLGQGAFAELWRYRPPNEINALFISHVHTDHCVDLVPLRHWVRYENGGRGPKLYGPADLRRRIDELQAQPEFLGDLAGDALTAGFIDIGSLRVEARPVTHIADSFGFRVSAVDGDGPGLVYSGDCGEWRDLVPLIGKGDTLLCEAAYGAGPGDGGQHLTAGQAAAAAVAGRAGRLILTHILDRYAATRLGRGGCARLRRRDRGRPARDDDHDLLISRGFRRPGVPDDADADGCGSRCWTAWGRPRIWARRYRWGSGGAAAVLSGRCPCPAVVQRPARSGSSVRRRPTPARRRRRGLIGRQQRADNLVGDPETDRPGAATSLIQTSISKLDVRPIE